MKTKIFMLITLAFSIMSVANAAINPTLNITGSVVSSWDASATSVMLDDVGTVVAADGIFSGLVGGTLTNLVKVIDLNITTGNYSARIFDNFLGVNNLGSTPAVVPLLDTYFLLDTVDDVIRNSTAIGESLRVDTHLQAFINGNNRGSFGFRWELSHNGITGSYSVSTLPFVPQPLNDVPVPAAVWLFGSSLLGLVSITRRKS